MKTTNSFLAVLGGLSVAVSVAVSGCGDTASSSNNDLTISVQRDLTVAPQPDLSQEQPKVDMTVAPDMGCFGLYGPPSEGSKHVEIINSCTTSVRIDKNPNDHLPFVNGALPPLP